MKKTLHQILEEIIYDKAFDIHEWYEKHKSYTPDQINHPTKYELEEEIDYRIFNHIREQTSGRKIYKNIELLSPLGDKIKIKKGKNWITINGL